MNYRQIEVFRAVVQAGSMTGAAKLLGISQPGVTKTIVALEDSCGYPLFQRQSGRITPTPEARELQEMVERMFVGVDEIRRRSNDIRDQLAGHLAIASFPALASRFLPRILSEFVGQRENVRLALRSMASRRVVEAIASQAVDVGIAILRSDDAAVEVEHLHRLERVCVVPSGHRLAKEERIRLHDLRDETFISLDALDPERNAIEKMFSDLGIGRHQRIETRHSDSACAFVANGVGTTIVDPFTPESFGDAIVSRPLAPSVHLDLWVLWPRHRARSKLTIEFVRSLRKALQVYAPRSPPSIRTY